MEESFNLNTAVQVCKCKKLYICGNKDTCSILAVLITHTHTHTDTRFILSSPVFQRNGQGNCIEDPRGGMEILGF